jgi:hypothetical protein
VRLLASGAEKKTSGDFLTSWSKKKGALISRLQKAKHHIKLRQFEYKYVRRAKA